MAFWHEDQFTHLVQARHLHFLPPRGGDETSVLVHVLEEGEFGTLSVRRQTRAGVKIVSVLRLHQYIRLHPIYSMYPQGLLNHDIAVADGMKT
jgi:hypothetical protein